MTNPEIRTAIVKLLARNFKYALCADCEFAWNDDMCTECYHPDSKWEASNQTISDCADMIMDLFSKYDADIEETLDAYRWRPFKFRQMTETEIARLYESLAENGIDARDISDDQLKVFDCELPRDGENIFVTNGKQIWSDVFRVYTEDIFTGSYLEYSDEIEDCMAWMPVPDMPEGTKDDA